MQNKFTVAVSKILRFHSVSSPVAKEFTGKFSSTASPFCEKGARFLNTNKPHKAKSNFTSALLIVERELKTCKEGGATALLQVKGEALLGLGKAQVVLQEGDDLGEINEKAYKLFTGAIEAFDSAGNLQLKAEALNLRSTVQGGKLKSAMDDLYEAFQIYKSLSDQWRMEGAAFSFVDISLSWGEAPYYEKALELLSALSSENKKVAEKISAVKSKLGDLPAAKKPADSALVVTFEQLLSGVEINLDDPRFAAQGLRLQIDGQDVPASVQPIPSEFRNIPPSYLPNDWADRDFIARLELNGMCNLQAPVECLPKRHISFTPDLNLMLAKDLYVRADELSKTDLKAALPLYVQVLEIFKTSESLHRISNDLVQSIKEKIVACGGTV